MLAGLVYLLMLGPLQGFGGQSPVFYNLPMAWAALIVVDALPALQRGEAPRRLVAAMLLAGFAVTIKTTAVFEAAFLGLFATATLLRSGAGPRQSVWPRACAAPPAGRWRERRRRC